MRGALARAARCSRRPSAARWRRRRRSGVALVASRWTHRRAGGCWCFVLAAALLLAAAALGLGALRRCADAPATARWRGSSRSARRRSTIGWSARSTSRNPAHAIAGCLPSRCWPTPARRGTRHRHRHDSCRASRCAAPDFKRPRRCSCSASLLFVGARPGAAGSRCGVADAVSRAGRARVTPGNARIKAGAPLAIQARLVGNRAPVVAQVQIADGDRWRAAEMSSDAGRARSVWRCASVTLSFKYRVVAGAVTSPTYDVVGRASAARHAHRRRLHLSGRAAAARRAPRADGGDIYAPAGTDVRVHVFTDRPAATGQMALGRRQADRARRRRRRTSSSASLKVVDDNSYRVALADRDGLRRAPATPNTSSARSKIGRPMCAS